MDLHSACPRCEGTGRYQRLPNSLEGPCSLCNGTGRLGPDGLPYHTEERPLIDSERQELVERFEEHRNGLKRYLTLKGIEGAKTE